MTNVRNLTSPFWRAALTDPANRCLVPVTAFAEWTVEPDPLTGRKRKVWFEVIDAEMFVFRYTASDRTCRPIRKLSRWLRSAR